MNKNERINWNFLAKYFAGETGAEGKEIIAEWLQESASNSVLYKNINVCWDCINKTKEMNQFDVNDGWERLHNRIVAASGDTNAGKRVTVKAWNARFSISFRKIAAAIIMLAMVGAGIYQTISVLQKKSMVTAASSGTDDQTRITLPDGTLVFLNANTKISYSKNFNTHDREVKLSGEAFFDVTPDPEKPFIIYSGNAGIKVVGTSFNVQALKSTGKVEVFVESGKVQLFETENISNTITIEPGYVGSIGKTSVAKQRNTDDNYLAWKTRKLVFDNSDLEKVAKGIQDVFKVSVVFENPDMSGCKIKSNFENESLENVLRTICTIHNWKWEKKGNKVILSGPGC